MQELEAKMQRVLEYSLLSAKNVLTLDDTALLTGLSKSYLYKLTCTHQIPYYKPNGKQIFLDKKEVEAWMKRNRYQSEDEAESVALAHVVASDRKGGVL